MRTIPPYSHQADVWIEMLKSLSYQAVVFIHSNDNDGRSTLNRFQNMADSAKVKIEQIIEYEPGLTQIAAELYATKNELACRVYILYASKEDAEAIFGELERQNMTGPGYVWLVSEQDLRAPNKPDGLLGLVLKNGDNEEAHIKDSVKIAVMALREWFTSAPAGPASPGATGGNYNGGNYTKPPSDCSQSAGKWEAGLQLLGRLKNQTVTDGSTGRIAFDDNGDRLDSEYDIINVVNGKRITIGNYFFSKETANMQLRLDVESIGWPGGSKGKPRGYFIATHLKIATLEEKPFVWVLAPLANGSCPGSSTPCPRKDHRDHMQPACCQGYCVDLLRELAKKLNFTYELYQVADGLYGSYDYSQDCRRAFNGLIVDLVARRADMVVAPLSINPERARVIDFSKPFKFQGIAMIQKRKPRAKKMESFLQPFKIELWLLVLFAVFVVAAVLYVLDRFSPFGKSMQEIRLTSEKSLNFSSAIWFSFGVLLNSGIGEKAPMSFSARVLAMVWAGFSMIVVASYTANLAAWLVLDTTETEISGLDDSRLRNPVEGFKYGTIKNSYVDMYFSSQVELSNMYRLMEEFNMATTEEALEAVRTSNLDVFFWDSPRLEYEAAHDCNLVISGETFARSGYGLGLQKGSFWSERVTLQTMSDVFMLVAGGMLGGLGLIVIEVAYKRRKVCRIRQLQAVREAVVQVEAFDMVSPIRYCGQAQATIPSMNGLQILLNAYLRHVLNQQEIMERGVEAAKINVEVQRLNPETTVTAWKSSSNGAVNKRNLRTFRQLIVELKPTAVKCISGETAVDEGQDYAWNSVRQFSVAGKQYVLGNFPGLYIKELDEVKSRKPVNAPNIDAALALLLAMNSKDLGLPECQKELTAGRTSRQEYQCGYCDLGFNSRQNAMAHTFGSGPIKLSARVIHKLEGAKRDPCQAYLMSRDKQPKMKLKMPKVVKRL
ncbi:Glutamate [NMDA] receptor subunit 1 [Halotydeus destructor]|nr:Glutamate [NMDA] receptor subunit 1 [Halotydeus destructor]